MKSHHSIFLLFMKISQRLALGYTRTKFKLLSSISKKKAAAEAFKLFCTPQSRDIMELPVNFINAETIHFNFDQYEVTGYRWNKGDRRKVLILHGFESAAI